MVKYLAFADRFMDEYVTYAYYISEPVAENDGKGVGPFLLAYGEL